MPKPKKKNKIVQPILRFYCEGEKTEPQYLQSFKDSQPSVFLDKVKWEHCKKNTPVQLVESAVNAKNKDDSNDIFWVVFDRESVSKYPDKLHQQARRKALDNGIFIAFSNVCFELWILLHFEYSTAEYVTCDDLIKNSSLKTNLTRLGVKDYEKGINIFDKIQDKIENATKNAIKVRKASKSSAPSGKHKPYQLNPYTDVDEILKAIQIFVKVKNKPLEDKYLQTVQNYSSINTDWEKQLDECVETIVKELNSFSQIEVFHFLYVLKYDKENQVNQDISIALNKDWNKLKDWNLYTQILEKSLESIQDRFK